MVCADNSTDIIVVQGWFVVVVVCSFVWVFSCFSFPLELNKYFLTCESPVVNNLLTSKVRVLQ